MTAPPSPEPAEPATESGHPVQLFACDGDECVRLLRVCCEDQVGFLFKLSELLTTHGIDVEYAEIGTEDGNVNNFMRLRAPRPTDFAFADEWCGELEEVVLRGHGEEPREPLANASRRLSVNPDLLSVASFKEVEARSSPGQLWYRLELQGINQAGLLAYASLVFMRSGFSIEHAQICTNDGHVSDTFDLVAKSRSAERVLRTYLDLPAHDLQDNSPSLLWGVRDISFSDSDLDCSSFTARKDEDLALLLTPPASANGKSSLRAPVHFKNGDVYEGTIHVGDDGSEKRQGYGMYTYSTDSHDKYKLYRGQWFDDKKGGFGMLFFRDGGAYVGQWKANDRHGVGVVVGTGGCADPGALPSYRYEGEWAEDRPHGLGVEETVDSLYCGQFVRGRRQGSGMRMRTNIMGVKGCSVLRCDQWQPLSEVLEAGEGDFQPLDRPHPGALPLGSIPSSGWLPPVSTVQFPSPATQWPPQARSSGQLRSKAPPEAGSSGAAGQAPPASFRSCRSDRTSAETPGFTSFLRPGAGGDSDATPNMFGGWTSLLPGVSESKGGARNGEHGALRSPAAGPGSPLASASYTNGRQRRRVLGIGMTPDASRGTSAAREPSFGSGSSGIADLPKAAAATEEEETAPSQAQVLLATPSCAAIATPPRSTAWRTLRSPIAGAPPLAQEAKNRVRRMARCPMLWDEGELATFVSCLGLDPSVAERMRRSKVKGASQLLEASDSDMIRNLGLQTALERLVVRRSLQRLLESDRWENSAGGRSFRDVLTDPVLGAYVVPLEELVLGKAISEGGFGRVYRGILCAPVKDGKLRNEAGRPRVVAVKEMKGDHHMQLYELLKEARVMASLKHPNICAFVGICADTKPLGRRYIMSEMMDCSLYDLVHRPQRVEWNGSLTVRLAVTLTQGICSGIVYIHARNLVHADLKSSNILIDHSSSVLRPRICDFGHAAVRPVPSPHDRLCTPHWASPEVLRREGLGPAADVFSIGVLLWEMLTKRLPHKGLSFGQVITAVGWASLVPDLASLPEVPEALRLLISECLSFLPSMRPRALEVQRRLSSIPHRAKSAALGMLAGFMGQSEPWQGKDNGKFELPCEVVVCKA